MLSQTHIEWFDRRGISPEKLISMGVYSAQRQGTGAEAKLVPSESGTIIAFPYFEHGVCVYEKYRTLDKKFWARPGGKRTFYNSDILDDPQLQDGSRALMICEGEIDCLSWLEVGYPWAVSVPDGAPPDRPLRPIDETNDAKYEFLLNNWDRLAKIKRIVLAVDGDGPGLRLRDEIARRLGKSRCYWVQYPSECKDSNDVLVRYGSAELFGLWHAAKPYPIAGIYTINDYPEKEFITYRTGWDNLDENYKPFIPSTTVIVGRTSHGKSVFANQLVAQLAHIHQWHIAIASFEMMVQPYLFEALAAVLFRNFDRHLSISEWISDSVHRARAQEFVGNHFAFITPELDEGENAANIDWLIERAKTSVIRYGTKALLIDPWNEIEHSRDRGENSNDYIGRVLQKLKRFAEEFDVAIFICVHPTKEGAKKSAAELNLYDASDSAHFANKADFGISVTRVNETSEMAEIRVRKVRFQPRTGRPTAKDRPITMIYDRASGTLS